MTYDEFADKLNDIKKEYELVKKKEMSTVEQLEAFLVERKIRRASRGLKNLRGLL